MDIGHIPEAWVLEGTVQDFVVEGVQGNTDQGLVAGEVQLDIVQELVGEGVQGNTDQGLVAGEVQVDIAQEPVEEEGRQHNS